MSAAHELCERGFSVEVHEVRDVPGGKARSIYISGTGRDGRSDLPGEHGFRFFPSFYKHLPDTMKRIPFGGQANGVFDNLVQASEYLLAAGPRKDVTFLVRFPGSLEEWRELLRSMRRARELGIRPGELRYFLGRLLVILTSCDKRRLAEYEKIHITDIAAAPGTSTHPADLTAFAAPSHAIYIDYSYALDPGVFAATAFDSCDSSTPRRCTQAHTYLNGNTLVTDTDFFNSDDAPSVGVFVHELGHVFGMQHINEDDDSIALNNPSNMWFDRTTIHGLKFQRDDHRNTVIQAATHAFLLAYYPAASSTALATDEIVAHHNMSIADTTTTPAMHIEFNPSKSYTDWGTGAALIADKNETKLRWNPQAQTGTGVLGAFEPCTAPGTLPRWFARMSETSTRTVNTPFEAVFQVSTTEASTAWTTVAERTFDSYVAGQADFRQIDWEKTFPIPAAAVGVTGGAGITTMTTRQLHFQADSTNVLAERDEQNNDWHVNLCLYPASDTTCQNASVVCAQP